MKIVEIKNKDGELLKTKEGKVLKRYTFEAGDEFIPQISNVITRDSEALINGKKKIITNTTLPVVAKDKDGKDIEGGKTVFVSLTPAQANSMKKNIDKGVEITQEVMHAYTYKDQNGEEFIGIGVKREFKPAKKFADFK